ncbi:MAG TPA: TMEM175 family protein [Thermoanaerobaculia bacterium]|nr:TMEM175 family protein [Thermoanaerobaculia bacterium]
MADRIPFRNRAHEVSRLEAFSDVIFGFAVSLLVVSLEVPKDYQEMVELLRGFVPFAVCFTLFIDIWFEHHHFFRRYAIHDRPTMMLNTVLLFVILFYVYPLKYMFTILVGGIRGEDPHIPPGGLRLLFTVYGLGFAAVFFVLAAMYQRAWKHRDELALNEVERIDTKESIYDNLTMGCFGVLSLILANVGLVNLAGPVYFLIAIPKTIVPWVMGARRRKAEVSS